MSAATRQAEREFRTAMRDPNNLIWFHQNSQAGQGRRHRQPTLNRAVVVLTAAAWQAYVQDTTAAILGSLAVPPGHQGHALSSLIRAATRTASGRFNTPNARNTLSLFDNVGFDPSLSWTFAIGAPARAYTTQDVRFEIDGWLDVRHSIAHGSPLPATDLVSGRTRNGPNLHRTDAERCIEFFERLVEVTSVAADQQFHKRGDARISRRRLYSAQCPGDGVRRTRPRRSRLRPHRRCAPSLDPEPERRSRSSGVWRGSLMTE